MRQYFLRVRLGHFGHLNNNNYQSYGMIEMTDILGESSFQYVHFRLDLLLMKPQQGYSVHEGIMSNLPGGVNINILPCHITV